MTSLAAPATQLLAEGGFFAQKCGDEGRSCGFLGYFAVALMLGVLCGGVFMLLQSSFGVLQGYLISGAAFWASWFVLAIIWFTGVPGVPLSALPGIDKDIPESTPRFYGPQGRLPAWEPVDQAVAARLQGDTAGFVPAAGSGRASDVEAIKAASTAATDTIAAHYIRELGADAETVTVPGTVMIDENQTQIVRSGADIEYIRFTAVAAKPGETATPEQNAAIARVQPASFIFKLDKGTEALQTYIALPLTLILFVAHLFGLMWYEKRHRPVPAMTARERERETSNA